MIAVKCIAGRISLSFQLPQQNVTKNLRYTTERDRRQTIRPFDSSFDQFLKLNFVFILKLPCPILGKV